MTTSVPSEPAQQTLFAEDSPAKTSASPAPARGLRVRDRDSGPRSLESFASLEPESRSWKTSQHSVLGGLEPYSETWPRSGLMRSGTAYLLPPLVPLTAATESGLWPTPRAEDSEQTGGHRGKPDTLTSAARLWPTPRAIDGRSAGPGTSNGALLRRGNARNLAEETQMDASFPTPSANDWKGSSKPGQRRGQLTDPAMGAIPAGGSLNPTWVEWLMGFPLGWTDCGASVTRSSRRSRKSSDT